MSATRQQVYEAIDTERAYQDYRWGSDAGHRKGRTIDEFALYLDVYVGKLKVLAATTGDKEQVTEKCDLLRKIAALGVSAMEHHGAPQRAGFENHAV